MMSKYSKNMYETASLKKSIDSAKHLSEHQKKHISKVLKKVAFFSLKDDSVAGGKNGNSMCDSDDVLQDDDHLHINAMNKSIQKKAGKLKRNIKSFNFTQS